MEEIYTLLEERFNVIEDLDNRISRLEDNKDSVTGNLHIKPSEIQDVSHIIHQLKRNEKLRNIKENDYLEIVFGLRNFDVPQRMRFQEKSYEIMKKIKLGFAYEKYKHTGETKDIAKLYLNFFLNMKLQSKVDDLKRAYANNKFIGYPIVSILLKWLVEVTRKNYQDLLRIKSEHLTVIGKANKGVLVTPKSEKAKVEHDKTINHENHLENPQQQMSRIMNDIMKKNAEMKADNKYVLPKINDSQLSQVSDSSRSKTIELRISSDHMKNSYRNYLDQKIIRGMDENATATMNNSTNLSMSQNTSFLTVKNINGNRMIKQNVQGNCIQLFVQHNQQAQNLLDPIEDLDLTSISTVYQIIHLYRQVRKIPGGNLIMIDLDKKKEMMNVIYKNLYYRNNEIERTTIYYQNKMRDRGMIDYPPTQPRKSDNYLENYSCDFIKQFSHMRGNIVPLNFNENNMVRVNKTQVNMATKAIGGSQKKIASSYLENQNASQHLTLTPHEDDRFDTNDKSVLKNDENHTMDKVNVTPQHENQFRITRNRMGPGSEEKKRVIRTGSWRQTVDDKSNLFQKNKDLDDSTSPVKLKQAPKQIGNEKYRSLSVNKMDSKNEPLENSSQIPKQNASPDGEMKLLYVGDITMKNFKTSDLIPRAHDDYKSQPREEDSSLNLDISPQRKSSRPPSGPNSGLKNILDIKETQDEDDLQSDK